MAVLSDICLEIMAIKEMIFSRLYALQLHCYCLVHKLFLEFSLTIHNIVCWIAYAAADVLYIKCVGCDRTSLYSKFKTYDMDILKDADNINVYPCPR